MRSPLGTKKATSEPFDCKVGSSNQACVGSGPAAPCLIVTYGTWYELRLGVVRCKRALALLHGHGDNTLADPRYWPLSTSFTDGQASGSTRQPGAVLPRLSRPLSLSLSLCLPACLSVCLSLTVCSFGRAGTVQPQGPRPALHPSLPKFTLPKSDSQRNKNRPQRGSSSPISTNCPLVRCWRCLEVCTTDLPRV